MEALVLGGTGFIGGQIARAALEAGWSVRVLRRRPGAVGALGDRADEIAWVEGRLEDREALRAAMAGCDLVFHTAAYYPQDSQGIEGHVRRGLAQITQVLEAVRAVGVPRLIYTSSLTTIGLPTEPGRLADERDAYRPGSLPSAYYETKYAMEQAVLRAAAQGLDAVVLCPTAVFGPGDVKPTTGRILLAVARSGLPLGPGKRVGLFPYVHAWINVVDVRDVAAAHLAAAERGRSGERYIVGGHNLTLREALTTVARTVGIRPLWLPLPRSLVLGAVRLAVRLDLPLSEHLRGLSHWQPLSTVKAEQLLGLRPRPFEETIRDAIAWFRQEGYL
ncbi:MAG: NAD-dependent epimerase/dehydratase family protein [Chloroflexi bacterium]|nr:MAG: NAD-dependent epimerase/dehydratase family protein [Chloroflexota bacterium]